MGGRPRRGLLFEGAPGTGKTLHRQGAGGRGRRAVPVRDGDVVPVQLPGRHPAQGPPVTSGPCARSPARTAAPIGFIDEFDAIGARPRTAVPRWHRRRRRRERPRCWLRRPGGPADVQRRRRARARSATAVHRWQRPADGGQRAAGADAVVRRADRRRRSCSAGWSTRSTCCCPRTASCAGPVGRRQHPADRLDQPGRLARPGAAAARPLRPAADLRAAGQGRPPPAHRPLPGAQGARRPSWTPTSAATRWPRSPRATARRCSRACSTRP